MKRCLRLFFSTTQPEVILHKLLPSIIKKIKIEGIAQAYSAGKVEILMCGMEEQLDMVVDGVYSNIAKYDISEIVLEPLLDDRNFRGVFRII